MLRKTFHYQINEKYVNIISMIGNAGVIKKLYIT